MAQYVIKCAKGYYVMDSDCAATEDGAQRIPSKSRADRIARDLNAEGGCGGNCIVKPASDDRAMASEQVKDAPSRASAPTSKPTKKSLKKTPKRKK